jgi:site-specific recombinase XerC
MRLRSALERFVVQLRANGRSVHTIDQYERHIRSLDEWLRSTRRSRDVRSMTATTLAAFLTSPAARSRPDGQPRKEVSVNALRSSLRVFFQFVHASGYSNRNAAVLIRRARCASPPPRALPEADCQRLLATLAAAKDSVARRDHLLFRILYTMGLRLGTALALDVRDVDLTAGVIELRCMKGSRPDRVAIPRALHRQLRAVIASRAQGPLFPGTAGRPMSARHARRRLHVWLQRAGARRASPHGLRHSYAQSVYQRTGDLLRVQVALRHRSVGSSAIYARLPDVR